MVACSIAGGCGSSVEPPSAETQQQASRLADIQKKTGGKWESLSKEDRDYLVNGLAHGSEASARMLLGPPQAKPPTPGGGPPGK
jgi:hypothetical protein